MAKKIYYAALTETTTEKEYSWNESHEAEYGDEWDGDVEAYLLNMADDEDEMSAMMNASFKGAVHNEKNGAIYLVADGAPIEMWWAE